MKPNAEFEEIRSARKSLEKFRLKLLRPSAAVMESGAADLGRALECLGHLQPALSTQTRRPAILERALGLEIANLRRELQQVHALMAAASKFYEGWARLLGSPSDDTAANYTPQGRPGISLSNQSSNLVMHG
jgi:hypothetical protein